MSIKFGQYEIRKIPSANTPKLTYEEKRGIERKAIDHILKEMKGYVESRLVPIAFRKMTDDEAFVVEMSIENVYIYHMM